jgi:hypothetical protein
LGKGLDFPGGSKSGRAILSSRVQFHPRIRIQSSTRKSYRLSKTLIDSILAQRVATKITGFSWVNLVQYVVFIDISSYNVYKLVDLHLI